MKMSGPLTRPPTIRNPSLKTWTSHVVLKQARADLKHPDSKVRMMATQFLGQCDPSVAIPILQEVLSDQDPDVRAEGLCSLMRWEDPIVIPLLKKHLRDSDPKVRVTALRGLFKYGEGVDPNVLLQFMSDDSAGVRRKVATLLGWSRMEGVLPTLVELSKDKDPQVRKAALSSIIILYPEESEDRILEALTDPDPDLRKWAKEVLEKITASPLNAGDAIQNSEERVL
jgi:HEAT repeat protein